MEVQREEKVLIAECKIIAKTMRTQSDSSNILDQKRGRERDE